MLWVAGITYFGYILGSVLRGLGIDIDTILLPIIALILIVSISPALYHFLKDKKQRQVIWAATKLEWRKIIERSSK